MHFVVGANHESDLVAPCDEDDGFLILLVSSKEVPSSIGIKSACLRFSTPVEFQCETPVRFLVVLVGPAGAAEEISQIGNSLAALAVDEDLVGSLDRAADEASFAAAMHRRLDDLPVMPRSHLEGHGHHHHHHQHVSKTASKGSTTLSPHVTPKNTVKGDKSSKAKAQEQIIQDHLADHMHMQDPATMSPFRRARFYAIQWIQKYSLPLVFGVLLALIWVNVDEQSYNDVIHGYFSDDFSIFGHTVSLHFIVNDIFMCLFFGLAIKEVTEALLPGGSLSPLRRAANPLCATLGGIIGPIACYFVMTLVMDAFGAFDGIECQVEVEGRRLGGGSSGVQFTGETVPCELSAIINGWGVPTATDISLAWMFALLIFGPGHPAINFLLLLAIVDDAIGMVIIAVFYGDKNKPILEDKQWLGLVVAAALLAYILRLLRVRQWPVFILVCGPVSWIGLLKAHVHPALALVAVVPFMPATHAVKRSSAHKGLGAVDWSSRSTRVLSGIMKKAAPLAQHLGSSTRGTEMLGNMLHFLQKQENAPLHLFEHHLKLPVDIGMFFFGLANAGVKLGSVGSVTACVLTSLIVGKTLGVAGFAICAHCCGFGLPAGISMNDLFAMGALAGVGLTVALFVSNEAFTDPGLQGQAKMGALLSIGSAGFSWLISAIYKRFYTGESDATSDDVMALEDSDDEILERTASGFEEEDDDFEDVITHELMEKMWEFRRYKARGHHMNIDQMARSVTRKVSRVSTAKGAGLTSSHELGNIVRSGSLGRIGPSQPDMARTSKKHATWATTHLR
jgi:NhaA family Na+:H+ antiporter